MSRETQYIGLNDYAREYVKGAVTVSTYPMTEGMFDEPINGHIYYMPDGDILKEMVQVVPWSSGPMIFTNLHCTFRNGIDGGHFFSWMVDPSVKGEQFCSKTGRYYV